MDFEYSVDNVPRKIILEKKEGFFLVSDGKASFHADIRSISPQALSLLVDGRSYLAFIARDKDVKHVYIKGHHFTISKIQDGEKTFKKGEEGIIGGKLQVKAPMPGKVIKVSVTEDEEIRKNQTLAIVEAMKMENEIKSSCDGWVRKIYVSAGDLVDSEKPLLELEAK